MDLGGLTGDPFSREFHPSPTDLRLVASWYTLFLRVPNITCLRFDISLQSNSFCSAWVANPHKKLSYQNNCWCSPVWCTSLAASMCVYNALSCSVARFNDLNSISTNFSQINRSFLYAHWKQSCWRVFYNWVISSTIQDWNDIFLTYEVTSGRAIPRLIFETFILETKYKLTKLRSCVGLYMCVYIRRISKTYSIKLD